MSAGRWILGAPPVKDRPVCFCGKPFRLSSRRDADGRYRFTGYETVGGFAHSGSCAIRFAIAAYRAGYRLKGMAK